MYDNPARLWTPPSHRFAGLAAARQACREYDPNLDFAFNEETQQWCVYLKAGTMRASENGDWPILGFMPKDRIPGPDEIKKRLYETDAFRIGQEMIDAWQRHNDSLQKDHSDADRQLAETAEWGFRKMGSDKAPIKVYMPGE